MGLTINYKLSTQKPWSSDNVREWLEIMTENPRGREIKSPIFEYANFEHLEHEGWKRFGKFFAPLNKCARL